MSTPNLKQLCAAATPGPWFTWPIKDYITVQSGLRWVAECRAYGIDHPTQGQLAPAIANAQLIARLDPQTVLAVYEFLEFIASESSSASPILEGQAKKLIALLNGETK
jgi:hypothetical protein